MHCQVLQLADKMISCCQIFGLLFWASSFAQCSYLGMACRGIVMNAVSRIQRETVERGKETEDK